MNRRARFAALTVCALAGLPTAAFAQDSEAEYTLCSDRPGLNTSACTVGAGHLQVELGLADWSLDRNAGQREDTISAGEVLVRYGLGANTEVRIGWDGYSHIRSRDRITGAVARSGGVGDVALGLKQMLAQPEGDQPGLSLALLPQVTLPVGDDDIGAGDWSASLIVPISYALGDTISLAATPKIDAAVDADGHGRHLAYGTAIGVELDLGGSVSVTPELQMIRDDDPAGHATSSTASLSFAVQPSTMTQFDMQAVAGLNHNTPDVDLLVGLTRAF